MNLFLAFQVCPKTGEVNSETFRDIADRNKAFKKFEADTSKLAFMHDIIIMDKIQSMTKYFTGDENPYIKAKPPIFGTKEERKKVKEFFESPEIKKSIDDIKRYMNQIDEEVTFTNKVSSLLQMYGLRLASIHIHKEDKATVKYKKEPDYNVKRIITLPSFVDGIEVEFIEV